MMKHRLVSQTHHTKIKDELDEILTILRYFYQKKGFSEPFELKVSSHALATMMQVGRVRSDQFESETQEIWNQIAKGLKQFKDLKITQLGGNDEKRKTDEI
jgi:hypothetical protein